MNQRSKILILVINIIHNCDKNRNVAYNAPVLFKRYDLIIQVINNYATDNNDTNLPQQAFSDGSIVNLGERSC